MYTYKEIVYMVADELKQNSKDNYFTTDHIIFLIAEKRALLLKQRYSDIKKQIPIANYQTIFTKLKVVPPIIGEHCEGLKYLRSINTIPSIMPMGITRIYPMNYFQGVINYVSRDRMIYAGASKYTRNNIFGTINPEDYLYLKSRNPQFIHLEQARVSGLFQDCRAASLLSNSDVDTTGPINILNLEFPLEGSLITPLIQMVVQELFNSVHSPEDTVNNDKDDLGSMAVK